MMSAKKTLFLCLTSLIIGAILFLFSKEWIIIRFPQKHTVEKIEPLTTKRQVTLWYFHHNQWKHEKKELLWSQKIGENMSQLISALLILFEEEQLLDKKTNVQSIALTNDTVQAFISFDRSPLPKQASIYTKWMMIESIVKTLRENGIKIQTVQFLTNHQPMQDPHLDFSHPWAVSGFAS